MRWLYIGIVLLFIVVLDLTCKRFYGHVDHGVFYVDLLKPQPPSLKIIQAARERDILAVDGGTYVMTFQINRKDFDAISHAKNFNQVDIQSNPRQWQIDSCNSTIQRLGVTNTSIEPTFECYEKTTATNRARLFYNPNENIALVLGFGSFENAN